MKTQLEIFTEAERKKHNILQKFTKEQAIIITGYTGFTVCNFGDFQEDVEKRLGRPVWTHEFARKEMRDKLKEAYKSDFISMCA